jgi:hypothetical protein
MSADFIDIDLETTTLIYIMFTVDQNQ